MVAALSSVTAELVSSWSAILGCGYGVIFVVVVSGLVLHVQGSEEAVLFLSSNESAMKWTEYREAVGREIGEGELMFYR